VDSPRVDLAPWLDFFRSRRDRSIDLPWEDEAPLDRADRARITRSIATFQLGESSAGGHLRASAARYGARHGLPELAEITPLFIAEEQLHAALLASFMKRHEIPFLAGEWSDGIFRALRRFGGFDATISVLLVAEIIAIPYYRALAAAAPSPVLGQICSVIVADERQHVAYESGLLRAIRARCSAPVRGSARALHALLYAGALAVVYAGHRAVLNRGGHGARGFWRAGWAEFRRYLRPPPAR
jgi:hypothetical protein